MRKHLNPRPITVAFLLSTIAIFSYLTFMGGSTQAATLSIDTATANTIKITVAGRYLATMETNDTANFITFKDCVENGSDCTGTPDTTHEFKGPCILETNTYCLRDDDNRITTILETTPTRVRIRVEGKLNNEASTDYLDDESGTPEDLIVKVEYTFTPEGVFVHNETDFRTTGVTLDAATTHNGYDWLGVYADVTDGAFNDGATPDILFGDGNSETSANQSDGATIANTNRYIVMPGTGSDTYQDAFVGIMRTGWYDDVTGGTHDWYWDEGEDGGTQDMIAAQEQNHLTKGIHYANWFFAMKLENDLDTEAEREGFYNDLANPDIPTYTTGSEWDDPSGSSGQSPSGASPGLVFDGSNDYVTRADDPDFDFAAADDFTVSVWAKQLSAKAESTSTYYFNSYDAGTVFADTPGNMIDVDTATFADNNGSDDDQINDASTCDGACGAQATPISKVELLIHGCQASGDDGDFVLTPRFNNGASSGDTHTWTGVTTAADCSVSSLDSGWFDITTDTNAPTWDWGEIQNLDVNVRAERQGGADILYASQVDIRVTSGGNEQLVTKADTTTGGYKLYMDSSGDYCFAVDDDSTWDPDDSACTSAVEYDDNKWHHVAGVKTGTTSIELFIDGTSVASDATIAATNTLANGNALYIGIDRDGTSAPWNGLIDEARIYNRALSANDIKQAMHQQISATTSGLVGYWRLDENTGTTVHDATTSNNDGTIAGPTWTTGYVPDQYNQAEGAYTVEMTEDNRAEIDLDAGANVSNTLNGAATARAATATLTASDSFPLVGVGFIDGDKFSYTTNTIATEILSGIPTSGDNSMIAHATGTVISIMNRHNPIYKFRNWRSLGSPDTVTLEGAVLTAATDYNSNLKPVTTAYFAQDLVFHATFESTTVDVGSNLTDSTCSEPPGRYGLAIQCDADSEDYTFTSTSNIDYVKGALEFWMQPLSAHTDNVERTYVNITDGTDQFRFRKTSGNTLEFLIDEGASTYTESITSANYDWTTNDWVHVRLEWDDAAAEASQLKIFINGSEKTRTDSTGDYTGASVAPGTSFFIGNSADAGTVECNCLIDELRIYDLNGSGDQAALSKLSVGGDASDTNEYLADETNDYTFDFNDDDANNRGEYIYLGSDSPFQGLNIDLGTLGVDSSADFDWEYWNGTGWSALTVTDDNTGASQFTANGNFYWSAPGNWFPYSVNGSTDLYYIRGHLEGGSYTTDPIENLIKTDILLVNYLSNLTAQDMTLAIPADEGKGVDTSIGGPPVSYWGMDEAQGTTVNDQSTTNNNDLTLSGATWTVTGAGMQPNQIYLEFDGTSDLLSRTHDGDFDFDTNSFSIAGWFRHSSTAPASNTDMIVSNFGDAGYKIYMNTSGYICFGIDADNSWTPADSACTTVSFADSRWHHFEAVKSGTTSILLYIDGHERASDVSLSATGSLNTDATFYIGIDSDGTNYSWEGFLDSIVVYHYARSAAQVKADMLGSQTGVRFGK